jgi:hypothetical protein
MCPYSTRCFSSVLFGSQAISRFSTFGLRLRRAKEAVADGTRNLLGQRGAAHRLIVALIGLAILIRRK